MKSAVLSVVVILFGLYLLGVVLLFVLQERLIFYPSKILSVTPVDVGLDAHDVWIKSTDGMLLHGWYLEQDPEAITVLFSHGNAGNISDRLPTMRAFAALGFNVLLYDYQGYGLSHGSPSSEQILADGLAAWDFLVNERGVRPENVLPVGRSLGGVVAATIAVEKQSKGLVLEETFTSITDVAAHYYPLVPVRWLSRVSLDTLEKLSGYNGVVLVAHSKQDEVIPYRMGRSLYESFGGVAFWLELQGRHSNGFQATGRDYQEAYSDFVAYVFGGEL